MDCNLVNRHNGHWWKEKDGEGNGAGGGVSRQQYQHPSEKEHFLPGRQTERRLYVFMWRPTDKCVSETTRSTSFYSLRRSGSVTDILPALLTSWIRQEVPNTFSLCVSHTHTASAHITGEHKKLSPHEMTCFHVCQRKRRCRKLRIPAACNRPQLWPLLLQNPHSHFIWFQTLTCNPILYETCKKHRLWLQQCKTLIQANVS